MGFGALAERSCCWPGLNVRDFGPAVHQFHAPPRQALDGNHIQVRGAKDVRSSRSHCLLRDWVGCDAVPARGQPTVRLRDLCCPRQPQAADCYSCLARGCRRGRCCELLRGPVGRPEDPGERPDLLEKHRENGEILWKARTENDRPREVCADRKNVRSLCSRRGQHGVERVLDLQRRGRHRLDDQLHPAGVLLRQPALRPA
mmetsp:Transcript_12973/g.36368  ORF Transcript_12973/g.36368 Transcript_12973/m.36368 type:complete len:201 (-) Transcript_12973:366-968(-)